MPEAVVTGTAAYAWVRYGVDLGFTASAVCTSHEGVPTSEKEDDRLDVNGEYDCYHVVRLFEDDETRVLAEENTLASTCPAPEREGGSDALHSWLAEGVTGGWASAPVCYSHEDVPQTYEEGAEDEPCVHVMRLFATVEEPEPIVEQPALVSTQSVTTQVIEEGPVATPAIPHADAMSHAGIKAEDHQLVYDLLLDSNGWREVSGSRLIDRTCAIGDLQVKLSCANYYVKAKYGTWQHAAVIELRR